MAQKHTIKQNAEHQKYYAKFADKDITDTIDIQVGYSIKLKSQEPKRVIEELIACCKLILYKR